MLLELKDIIKSYQSEIGKREKHCKILKSCSNL